MRKSILILFFTFFTFYLNAKEIFIPIDPHGGNIGSIGGDFCSSAMMDFNKDKVIGYIQGYLAGYHSSYFLLNKDKIKNRYKNVSSDISVDTIYSILKDMCKKKPNLPLFDMMNLLLKKLIRIR